jgi:hypothetical protein
MKVPNFNNEISNIKGLLFLVWWYLLSFFFELFLYLQRLLYAYCTNCKFHKLPECIKAYLSNTVGAPFFALQCQSWLWRRAVDGLQGQASVYCSTYVAADVQFLKPTTLVSHYVDGNVWVGNTRDIGPCQVLSGNQCVAQISWQTLHISYIGYCGYGYLFTLLRDICLWRTNLRSGNINLLCRSNKFLLYLIYLTLFLFYFLISQKTVIMYEFPLIDPIKCNLNKSNIAVENIWCFLKKNPFFFLIIFFLHSHYFFSNNIIPTQSKFSLSTQLISNTTKHCFIINLYYF